MKNSSQRTTSALNKLVSLCCHWLDLQSASTSQHKLLAVYFPGHPYERAAGTADESPSVEDAFSRDETHVNMLSVVKNIFEITMT